MTLSFEQCYQALLARDARFDGRFFVAVTSTRIYCRPICRVKAPLKKNCRFFAYAAAAEVAGYRPCKRCRPELAPGASPMESGSQLARRVAIYIGDDFLSEHSLTDLAVHLGVTDRQMRRAFREEFGVSPVEFWQTQRLLLSKQLLTDSDLPVSEIAYASGFKSLRRFNTLIKARYRLAPGELRKQSGKAGAGSGASSEPVFHLGYRPPLAWDKLLGFLAARAIPGVEAVRAGNYLRTVRLERRGQRFSGHLRVEHEEDRNRLAVHLSGSLLPVSAVVLEWVRRLFDLQADPSAVGKILGKLAEKHPGLRVPGSFDGFEMAVRAILGQQISVAGATTLAGRIARQFGTPVTTPYPELDRHFPDAAEMAAIAPARMRQIGLPAARAATVLAVAGRVAEGQLFLEPGRRVEETLPKLLEVRGIGEWTAQYLAMRALSWPDAFPHSDLGIRKALGDRSPKEILKIAEQWRPWRAYAALQLWNSIGAKA